MQRPAAPGNGGLCASCAPPLRTPRLRAFMAARRAMSGGCCCHLLAWGATAGCPRSGYGLGA